MKIIPHPPDKKGEFVALVRSVAGFDKEKKMLVPR
jgi:hypothetical protein